MKPPIILIHGNAVGINFAVRPPQTKYGNFKIFEPLIDSGVAKLFNWNYINEDYSLLHTINPFKFRHQYLTERNYCQTKEAFNKLFEFLDEHKPEKIVTHSMGGFLLLKAINSHGLPSSVKKVYLTHLAVPSTFTLENQIIIDRINVNDLGIYNYFTPFDQMLLLYILAHGHMPGGMVGMKSKYIVNQYIKEFYYKNPHASIIASRKFLHEVAYN